MTIATDNIHEAAEQIANGAAARLTPEQLDDLARRYLEAKAAKLFAGVQLDDIETEILTQVQLYGAVPPNAEKSRRLNGRLAEFTVTKADAITINPDRVETLHEALEANGHGDFFPKLFALQAPKYEIVNGAEAALKEVALPRRLAEKVMNLFGRCITVKPKKPSLKVSIADPAKPAKKARAKKGGE